MNEHLTQGNMSLKQGVLERIKKDQVCPRSRWFFRTRECSVWFLWLLSIVVGALAVAVSLFVVLHRQYALYEATHENFFTFMVAVLPYIWIIVFGIMVYVAVYNLRHTKHGYRYPVWQIVLSSLVLSFAGGSALQFFGMGYSFDHVLGERMNMYMSQEKLEAKMWQAPEDGRLLGRQVHATVAPTSTIVFEDVSGGRWRVNIEELQTKDIELLDSAVMVRMIGAMVDTEARIFHTCGVFPWMMGERMTLEDLSEERREFVTRLYRHRENAQARQQLPSLAADTSSAEDTNIPLISLCAEMAVTRRVEARMN